MTEGRPPERLFGELRRPLPEHRPQKRSDEVPFVHSSERLFARLLEFYGIGWEYEPTTFDLQRNEAGEITDQFTPDFYLPEYDLYVELTTMSQKLVTRKNRKIRLLAERHPDVRLKILYRRDLANLAAKHGLEMPSEDFTGGGTG